MKWFLVVLWLTVSPLASAAGSPSPQNWAAWLNRVALAAQQLNYTGTFVYQHGATVDVSRVAHRADGAEEMGKIDVLSGSPHEYVSINDQVFCYVPDGEHVKVEQRKHYKFFPALLPVPATAIAAHYTIKPIGRSTIAGHDCIGVILEPKDDYRFGYQLWADATTGLLLKAVPLDANNNPTGQFVFTQIEIGNAPERGYFKSAYAGKKIVTVGNLPIGDNQVSWSVKQLPGGFNKVMEANRLLPGKKTPVRQLVYSDGLATVSLFIEPYASVENPMRGLSSQGLVNVYARPLGKYQITVLGEVPPNTVIQMADSLKEGN